MGIFSIFKRFSIVRTKDYVEAKKGLEDLKTISNYSRPDEYIDPMYQRINFGHLNSLVTPLDLYEMALYSDILRNVLTTLRTEIFRKGFDINGNDIEGSKPQKEKVEALIKKANHNRQTLKDVLMEIEDDLNIFDNAYLYVIKNYFINSIGKIVGGEIEEIIRLDPLATEKMMDRKARLGRDRDGNEIFFSLANRGKIVKEQFTNGKQNLRACYKVKTGDGKEQALYYDSNEVLHISKYRPSKTYGFSQLYSLYNKVMTLVNMDYYIKQYYSGNKVPKGILTVNTSNSDSFRAMWNKFLDKVRKNPHELHPIINQTQDGKDAFNYINFMNNLQEMQYTAVRDEIRAQIGALFNVSPIFQNDVSTGGGLNNEGLQITVTNRGVEMGQSIYNDKVLPFIFEINMGITDWNVTLIPSEEQDELVEKDLRLKELAIAKATAELGIEVSMEKDGDFSYKEGKVELQTQQDQFIPFDKSETPKDVIKAIKPTKAQVKEIENALDKELKEILKEFDFKRRPNESTLKAKIDKIMKSLEKKLNKKSSTFIKKIYEKAKSDAEKDIGKKFALIEKDKNIIEALKRDPTYRKSFSNITTSLSNNIKDIITKAYDDPKTFTIDNLVKDMSKQVDESTGHLRTIARTETSKISIAARKVQYDKTGVDYLFKWIGPDDDRTGEDSKLIKKATEKGVTWDELVSIIQKVAGTGWTVNKEAPIPRPNTRHTFIAIRKK